MKNALIIAALFISSAAFPQTNRVSEAKANITKKHHDAMVAKAERLLNEKTLLERQLAEVDKKIAKVDSGEDQEEDSAVTSGNFVYTGVCGNCWTSYTTTGTAQTVLSVR